MKRGGRMIAGAVGWVRIRLVGAVSGRRLNEITARMKVRNVRPVRGGMEMDVRAGRLNELRHMLHGSGLRMRVVRRYGVVRLRRAAKRRGALVTACLCMLLAMLYLSQTALQVRVEGAKDAAQEKAMLEALAEQGIRTGAYIGGVDKKAAAESILMRFKGLTYAMVRRRGTALELFVVQATEAPEVYDASLCTDVVAEAGGLVTRVVVLSGEAQVAPGDTVVEGQVLIKGTDREPHARGAVTARVWAVGTGTAQMKAETRVRTGRQHVHTYVETDRFRFPEAEEEKIFAQEDVVREETRALDGLFFPVRMVKCVHHEAECASVDRTISDVKDESGARAMTNALLELKNGACVVDKRVEYSMIKDGMVWAKATLECVMQIGREKAADAAPPEGYDNIATFTEDTGS